MSIDALNRRLAALESQTPPIGRPPALIVVDPLVEARIDGFDEVFQDAMAALNWLIETHGEPAAPDLILRIFDPPEGLQSAEFAPVPSIQPKPLPNAESARHARFSALSDVPESKAKPDHPDLRPGIHFYEIL